MKRSEIRVNVTDVLPTNDFDALKRPFTGLVDDMLAQHRGMLRDLMEEYHRRMWAPVYQAMAEHNRRWRRAIARGLRTDLIMKIPNWRN